MRFSVNERDDHSNGTGLDRYTGRCVSQAKPGRQPEMVDASDDATSSGAGVDW
ncbi:hypothetical protein [Rhodococcus erythropolis]|uniref:hypothetical protein n=1 Tax=Rhodococcus erythropolis TaxID=1833 RepID=UPI001290AFF2|nr:hypothetical protein [Rhodococcus erythropolis]